MNFWIVLAMVIWAAAIVLLLRCLAFAVGNHEKDDA